MQRISKMERDKLVEAGLRPGKDIIRPASGKNYYLVVNEKTTAVRNKVYGR